MSLLDRRVSVKEKSQGRQNKQLVRHDDERETKTRERNKNQQTNTTNSCLSFALLLNPDLHYYITLYFYPYLLINCCCALQVRSSNIENPSSSFFKICIMICLFKFDDQCNAGVLLILDANAIPNQTMNNRNNEVSQVKIQLPIFVIEHCVYVHLNCVSVYI